VGWAVKKGYEQQWQKAKSPAYLDNLPNPEVLALDIVENLEAVLDICKAIIVSLNMKKLSF